MERMEIIKQLSKKTRLTIEETRLLLDSICSEVKEKFNITKEDPKKCIASHNEILKICLMNEINFSDLYTEGIGLDDIPHYLNFIGLNTELGDIWFLVDPTYIQFDCDKYLVDEEEFFSPGKNFPVEYKKELIRYGYITYTKEHFYSYIDAFVKSINEHKKTDIKVEDIIIKVNNRAKELFFSTIDTIQDSNKMLNEDQNINNDLKGIKL